MCKYKNINFQQINNIALTNIQPLLERWLPDGKCQGQEYIAINPNRADQKSGSFKINLRSGKWADFATGDKGGDVISLAAYLSNSSQYEAALNLSDMLGVQHG